MKKRILAILCSTVMLLCLLPSTAFAAGTLEGVDYTRIGGSGSRVTLTLGNLEFEGQLSRGTLLTQNEQDKIITQTMNDMKITSGMLINAKSLLDKANKIEGFNLKDVKNALFKLTGVENAVDLYNAVMGTGDKSSAQIAAGIAKDQMLDAAEDELENILTNGGKVAMKGAGKFAFKLLFILPDLTEIGVDALTKYENIKETIAVAVERQVLLDTFYETCNKRITDASGGEGEWKITFNSPVRTYNCTLWGIGGIMMQATLSGELTQSLNTGNSTGQYSGMLTLELEGIDMAGSFDARITGTYPFTTTWATAAAFQKHTDDNKTTVLKRKVQGEIAVTIADGSGVFTPEVSGSLTSGMDETAFAFDHKFIGSSTLPYKGTITRWWHYTSADPGYLTETTEDGSSATLPFPGGVGTVWKPLESKPVITVYK